MLLICRPRIATLLDLYLEQDVQAFKDVIASKVHERSCPLDTMHRRYFDGLQRVDVALDMRHDQLPHKLCTQWVPISVDPVVHELFGPWCEHGIVEFSKIFRMND